MIQIWQVPSECGPSNLVVLALLEFKSRPGLDEGIFESYVHLNIVVPDLEKLQYGKGQGHLCT